MDIYLEKIKNKKDSYFLFIIFLTYKKYIYVETSKVLIDKETLLYTYTQKHANQP